MAAFSYFSIMMKRFFSVLLVICSFYSGINAQTDSSRLRVSMLTCGVGDEIWETFGHTAIRVTDSTLGTDMVYNYGTFGFSDDFEMQFMKGKLLYYVSYYPYTDFLDEYVSAKRSVQEQVLLLNEEKKKEVSDFLKENAKEENRYYKYDFFFDNCATRIRDVFPRSLGKDFHFAQVIPTDSRITFRQIINRYFYKVHFERFGINLLLGSRIDKVMTNEDIMFLPDYLRDGLAKATINGNRVTTDPELLVPGSFYKPAGFNWMLLLTLVLAGLTIIGLTYAPLHVLGKVMSSLLLLLTGLLGTLMVVMWLGTDHQGCQNNYNILWALPTNLILAFIRKSNKGRYALVAIILIGVSLVLHVLKVQELPILELSPLLLALLFVYGSMYKRDKISA